jgi:hypothetical protein
VVNTSLVNGVAAATEGDDARPRERETVGLRAEVLEQGNVLGGAVVRVTGGLARRPVGDLARNLGEGIPDRRATAVLFNGAFDLVPRVTCQPVLMYEFGDGVAILFWCQVVAGVLLLR